MPRLLSQAIRMGEWEFQAIRQLSDSPTSRIILGEVQTHQRPAFRAILKVLKRTNLASENCAHTALAKRHSINPPAVLWHSNNHSLLGCAMLLEYIKGYSLWLRAFSQPQEVGWQMAKIHSDIHSTSISAPENALSIPNSRCSCAESEEVVLVHNDLHPGNIIQSSSGTRVIDWSDSTLGCPAADVAISLLLLDLALARWRLPKALITGRLNKLVSSYIHTYTSLTGMPLEILAMHYRAQFPIFRHRAIVNAYVGLGANSFKEELRIHTRLRPVAGQQVFSRLKAYDS